MRHLLSKHPLIKEYQELMEKINLEINSIPDWQILKNFYENDEPFILDKKIQYLDKNYYPHYFKKLPSINESLFFTKLESGVYSHRGGVTEFSNVQEQKRFIQNQLDNWAENEKEVRKEYTFWTLDKQLTGNLEQNIEYIRKEYEAGGTFIIHLSSLEENLKYTIIKKK